MLSLQGNRKSLIYQTTGTLSNWTFLWCNTYNFQQDVFLVYLEANEMNLEATT
jgi:hypothetical protein